MLLLPRFDDPQRPGRHAVDAPVRVAVVVADGDGEAAVVGPDDVQELALLAGAGQPRALARVRRQVRRLLLLLLFALAGVLLLALGPRVLLGEGGLHSREEVCKKRTKVNDGCARL